MRRRRFKTCLVLLSLLLLQRVDAQSAQAERPQGASAEQERPEDPLGRSTPHGTVIGLVTAAEQEDFDRAAEYLDSGLVSSDRRQLAQKLGVVLDRRLFPSLGRLSKEPDGDRDDGLINRDRIGLVESPSGNVEMFLDRVQRGQANPIWLFSSSMLQEIPRLYDEIHSPWIERHVPEPLRTTRWLSLPLYQWIAVLLLIPLIFGVGALFTRALTVLLHPVFRRLGRGQEDSKVASVGPLRLLVLALVFHGASSVAISLAGRIFWSRVAQTLTVMALCWLSLRLMDVASALIVKRLQRIHRSAGTALVLLINRLSKAAAVIVAGLVLLYLSDFNLTAALTGLGVGGLAIGFGAQKTIENLFGGIMMISDKPVNVGEVCRAGEFFGTVEDIGLRSTRIRTLNRTVVSIPNGQLASMSLENFTVRDRIWLHQKIGLRCQTTADQLRQVLAGIRRLLEAHPKIDSSSARIRFIGVSGLSLDLEIFAYVLVCDQAAFLAIQEDLLLDMMDVIDASGTSLAFPFPAALLAGERALDA
jgi:MscS family membrane protein